MLSRIGQSFKQFFSKKNELPLSIDLPPLGAQAQLEEVKEANEVSIELNIFKNLKISVAKLEAQLRHELEKVMEPEIYRQAIRDGRRDRFGRYSDITKDKNDLLFYYLNVFNLLIEFQQVMGPVSDLHEAFTQLLENKGTWGKVTSFWSQSDEINNKLNTLGDFYRNFLYSIRELELDTVLGRLPALEDLKTYVRLLAPVKEGEEKFNLNPFVDSYKKHVNEWRQLAGLPPAAQIHSDEDEDDDDYVDDSVAQELAKEEALKILKSIPKRMDGIHAALIKILHDLSGSEVAPAVKKEFEKTVKTVKQILKKVNDFAAGPQNWRSVLKFAYEVYPMVKELLASLPQSYVSVNKMLKEHLLTTARQLNLIVRDWFLYADRLESQFYLKDGFLLSLGQGKKGCGLFLMQTSPELDQAKVNELLGESKDAYIFSGNDFYYVHRIKERIKVKKLEVGVQVPYDPAYTLAQLKMRLDLTDAGALAPTEAYRCIHETLRPHQQQLIKQATQHGRNSRRFDDYDLSMSSFAKGFNDWIEGLGYEFKPEERYPYTQTMTEQRQESVDENAEEKDDESLKKWLLAKRLKTKADQLAAQTALAEASKQEKLNDLLIYKRRLVELQINKRIADLSDEIKKGWIFFTDTKKKTKKIVLLEALKREFTANLSDNLPTVLGKMKAAGRDISLLEEGRTGKLLVTLRMVTSTPADRVKLIDEELVLLKAEVERAKNYWFFAKLRQDRLKIRVAALENLNGWLKQPGYRLQEALDHLNAKTPEHFHALTYSESKLLKRLQMIEGFTPDFLIGKKIINYSDEIVNADLANKQTQKTARAAARLAARTVVRTTHFFPQAKPLQNSAPATQTTLQKTQSRVTPTRSTP